MITNKEVMPAIRFALREYRTYINLAALTSLENPEYLQFLFEDKRKLLVIAGSFEKKKYSFKIPERTYRNGDDECFISRMALTEAFRLRMGWDENENYRVTGELDENLGMLVFNLSTADIVVKYETKK